MLLSHRLLVPIALAVALLAAAVTVAGARDSSSAAAQVRDDGPRNPAAEAATGDRDAMLAVVQDIVDCLHANGFDPGDPQAVGANVVIADWNPAWDSAAARATNECAFPRADREPRGGARGTFAGGRHRIPLPGCASSSSKTSPSLPR